MNTSLLLLKAIVLGSGMLFIRQPKKGHRRPQSEANTQSAVSLIYYFKINPEKAAKRFNRVQMYISGSVDQVGQDSANRTYVTLQAGKEELRTIKCYLTNADEVAQLQPGQHVVLWGTCQGSGMDVLFTGCELASQIL